MAELTKAATTQERLREAMAQAGKKQTDLAKATGPNKSIISRCVNGLVEPDQKTVLKLARALDVSEMWLWGHDVPKSRTPEQKKNDDLSKVIACLRKDSDFLETVVMLSKLAPAEYASVKQILNGLVNK